jgi:hypothetical protein
LLLCLVAACRFDHGFGPDEHVDSADATLPHGDATVGAVDAATDGAAGTSMLILRPSVDSWLRQQFPDEIHGNDGDLRTGSGSTFARANRIVLAFDVSAIPNTCTISDARLFLYFFQEDFSGVSPTFEAHRITQSWSETVATWTARNGVANWTNPGSDYDSTAAASTVITAAQFGWKSWNLTTLTLQWRSGTANYGVTLLEPGDNAGNNGRKLFHSMQSDTSGGDNRPYLRVTCN